jgi:hydrogenase maturation protease
VSAESVAAVLVIGLGNALRHDDDAGLEVARLVRARVDASAIAVLEYEGEPLGLIERWSSATAAILVDATRSGAAPGAITRFDAAAGPMPSELGGSPSTHAVGLAEAVELARELGRLPARVVVYGVEGARFDAGSGLSPEVRAAVPSLAEAVAREAMDRRGRPICFAQCSTPP